MEKPSDGISAIPTSLAEIGFLLFFILMTAFISKEWISAQAEAGEEEQDCEQCQRELDEIRVSVSELISKEECRERLDKAVARMHQGEQNRLQELISLEECRGEHERLKERVAELEQRLKEPEDVAEAYAALAANTHNPEKPTSEEISETLVEIAEQAEKKGIALKEISEKLAGEGIPSCWRSRERKTQSLYDAYVYDDGTTVFKLAKHPDHLSREEEGLAIPGVSDMPDGRVNINGTDAPAKQFEEAAIKIKEYGMKHGSRDLPGHECIHIVRIHNEEEVCGSDGAYEGVRKKLEVYFYKDEVKKTC